MSVLYHVQASHTSPPKSFRVVIFKDTSVEENGKKYTFGGMTFVTTSKGPL